MWKCGTDTFEASPKLCRRGTLKINFGFGHILRGICCNIPGNDQTIKCGYGSFGAPSRLSERQIVNTFYDP